MPPPKKVSSSTKKSTIKTKSKKVATKKSTSKAIEAKTSPKKKTTAPKKDRTVAKSTAKISKSKPNISKKSASTKSTPTPKTKTKNNLNHPTPVDSPFKNFDPYEAGTGEVFMSDSQLNHFREILLSWRQELMEEVDRTMNHMQEEAVNYPDPTDRAAQEEEFSIELKTRDRERRLIKKIDQTIDRIDQEDYGYCDTCGIEIGLRRLEARPTANQCIDCKSHEELRERQLHG